MTTATAPLAAPIPTVAARTMRAVAHRRYGEPQVLAIEDVPAPSPGRGEVLVRVAAAGVTIGDHHVVTGRPYLVRVSPFGGMPRPKRIVPGGTLSGRIEALGDGVTEVSVGDEVIGHPVAGAFGELAVVPVDRIARKPANLELDTAAAVPWAIAALQGLRDAGRLVAGQRVLVVGASGAVGTWAVQIAKAMGGEVTAVCSEGNAALMRELGADAVIDYRREDYTAGTARYDLVFDLVGDRSLGDLLRVLEPRGTYVAGALGPGDWLAPMVRLAAVGLRGLFSRRRLAGLLAHPNRADLTALVELVEAGKARPVIARRWALTEIAAALDVVGSGRSRGQQLVRVAP
ncbi:MAG: NAD(P)-dependent alcohol dehydrogenase [Nannocystaceae bacterium]|nr:NAD(P)-dependent alcohol dehydrogenase [Nannocystaceae bacterium]